MRVYIVKRGDELLILLGEEDCWYGIFTLNTWFSLTTTWVGPFAPLFVCWKQSDASWVQVKLFYWYHWPSSFEFETKSRWYGQFRGWFEIKRIHVQRYLSSCDCDRGFRHKQSISIGRQAHSWGSLGAQNNDSQWDSNTVDWQAHFRGTPGANNNAGQWWSIPVEDLLVLF